MKVVYSLPVCAACTKLKRQYISEGIEFEEKVIGKDITKEDFFNKYPNVKSVPFVVNE